MRRDVFGGTGGVSPVLLGRTGLCGVWWVCSRSARRSTTEVVEWVCWRFSGRVDACTFHTHVLFEWED